MVKTRSLVVKTRSIEPLVRLARTTRISPHTIMGVPKITSKLGLSPKIVTAKTMATIGCREETGAALVAPTMVIAVFCSTLAKG